MNKIDDRYKNSKIYEITSNNTDMVYVGSCCITLKKRLSDHKKKKNCSSKYILEFGDYNINLIEDYSCNNLDELRIREQYWIDKYKRDGKNVINKKNAYTSKLQRQEYYKEYHIKNREKRNEYKKNHYANNREKENGRNKKYYANNREKEKERKREYRFMNKKEYINACYEFLEMLKQY